MIIGQVWQYCTYISEWKIIDAELLCAAVVFLAFDVERIDVKNVLFASLLALANVPSSAAAIVSGDYDGLLIGVDQQGVVTGYFESSTGAGKFSCIFFISGKLNGNSARVDTWFPKDLDAKQVIRGVLEQVSHEKTPAIRLTLPEEHGGCWNVQHFATDPASFTLSTAGKWTSIRIVAAPKAYFYDAPASGKPRKAYAVPGNAVRVFESRDGWVKAEYVSEDGRATSGWLMESALFTARSPAAVK